MSGASLIFVCFSAVAILLTNLTNVRAWRQAVLLVASLLFLWICADGQSLIPLFAFLALGFASLKLIGSRRLRAISPIIILIVLVYVWLKKYTFLPATSFLRISYTTLGLSYIFFRVIHLLVDADHEALPDRVPLLSYLLYTLNFTSLVAGPIQRYQDFVDSEREAKRPSIVESGWALERIIVGFFKTNVLALAFSVMQHGAIAQLAMEQTWRMRVWQAAVVIATYPFFLYCNFAGYIDIVIGIARLMGLTLPENFDRPFSATSFIDFWNRWHITLSNWLKTYVYIPVVLGLMSRFPAESLAPLWGVLAFFITFFLVGAWHGQTSAFLFFGVLQGLGVSVNKLYEIALVGTFGRKRYKAITSNPIYSAVARGLTFTWFAFTLLWFWSSWGNLGKLAAEAKSSCVVAALGLIWIGATIGLAIWETTREAVLKIQWGETVVFQSRYIRTAWCTALVLITLTSFLLVQQQAPEIVYKAF